MRNRDPRGDRNGGSRRVPICVEDLGKQIDVDVDRKALIAPGVRVSEALLLAGEFEIRHRGVQDLLSSVALADETPATNQDDAKSLGAGGCAEAALRMAARNDADDNALLIGNGPGAQHPIDDRASIFKRAPDRLRRIAA
jgi:hypothetical protein